MTEQELEQIEARANAATPGPWTGDRSDGTIKYKMLGGENHNFVILDVDHKNNSSGFYTEDYIPYEQCTANEEFVKHARTDIPALIAEVRRLEADLEHVTTVGESLATSLDGVKADNARLKAALESIGDEASWSENWCDPKIVKIAMEALKGGEG